MWLCHGRCVVCGQLLGWLAQMPAIGAAFSLVYYIPAPRVTGVPRCLFYWLHLPNHLQLLWLVLWCSRLCPLPSTPSWGNFHWAFILCPPPSFILSSLVILSTPATSALLRGGKFQTHVSHVKYQKEIKCLFGSFSSTCTISLGLWCLKDMF